MYLKGECLVESNKVKTFDGVVYNPQIKENCQYLILAAIETELAVLVDRSNKTNQVTFSLINRVNIIGTKGTFLIINYENLTDATIRFFS